MDGRISNFNQISGLRRYTVTEGTEKGIDVIDCDNGKVRFLINVSKACDIMQLFHEGKNISFISKNGFTLREIPFINRFEGGMLYTCGLNNVGDREGYELHGTIHNTPAQIIHSSCDENGIVVEAIIRNTALFGKNLVLKRKIMSALGQDKVTLVDTLINAGFSDEQYCLLYHINIGYPMLDDGARIIADVKSCEPRTDWSKQNISTIYDMCMPVANQTEFCYFLSMNSPKVSLINSKIGKSFTVSYSADTLPHFIEWKSMVSGDYALGFEPATTELDGKFKYKTIRPGEEIVFSIDIDVENI